MSTSPLKKIPYGLSDFKRIKTENYYYIDKTEFIPLIEDEASFLFFLRPRRFGKSLTLAMFEAYYDIYYKEQFDEIFEDTYILDNPTPKKSSYFVMRFDFSGVDITDYDSSFRSHINLKIQTFIDKYSIDLKISDIDNPIDNMSKLLAYSTINSLPLYIFIDEYDNFVTKLLISDMSSYRDMVTDKSAIYKEFFTMLKVGTTGNDSAIRQIFITGVSPLALYDVTSGSNIGINISMSKHFNDMVGVTKDELKEIISYYQLDEKRDEIIARCDMWYNNYKFSENISHTIYNSDMVLFYINHLIRYDKEPNNLIDTNVRTDYSKLKYLVYTDKRLNGNFELLNNLIEGKEVTTLTIKDNFSTIEKYRVALKLSIPNQTLKKLLSEFIHYAYRDFDDYSMKLEKFNEHLLNLAYDRSLEVFRYISDVIKSNSSLRDYIDGENFIKAYLLAYLNLNTFYEVISERESQKGFVDDSL